MDSLTIEAMAARLERVERQGRRWRRGGVAAASIAVLALTLGAARRDDPQKIVDTEHLVLRDKAGKVRAVLGLTADGRPGLWIQDPAERPRVFVGLGDDDEAGLWVKDAEGRVRLGSRVTKDGWPTLDMRDEQMTRRADLQVRRDGVPAMNFRDRGGTARLTAIVAPVGDGPESPSLLLSDKRGDKVAQLAHTGDLTALDLLGAGHSIQMRVDDEMATFLMDEGAKPGKGPGITMWTTKAFPLFRVTGPGGLVLMKVPPIPEPQPERPEAK